MVLLITHHNPGNASYFTHAMLLSLTDRHHTPLVDKAAEDASEMEKETHSQPLPLLLVPAYTTERGHSALPQSVAYAQCHTEQHTWKADCASTFRSTETIF